MAIITVNDLAVRLSLTEDEKSTYSFLLDQIVESSSAVIEGYCNRSFSSIETVTEKYDVGIGQTSIILKHAPIVDVEYVLLAGKSLVENVDYFLYKDSGRIAIKRDLTLASYGPQALEVKYSHGYQTAPNDVKEITLELAAAMFNKASVEGISSEKLGDYSVEYEDYLFHLRYSTEWSLAREILEKYRLMP